MPDTLKQVAAAWGIDASKPSPILLPDYSRKHLAKLFLILGFTSGAEIGVGQGQHSRQLCAYNPPLHLLCVDKWLAYPASRHIHEITQDQMDGLFEQTKALLAPFNATIIRKSSIDAAQDIPDGSLDFVHIDASHKLQNVVADLAAWEPKIRPGGIVSGHDFTHARFTRSQPLTPNSIYPGPDYKPCHVIEAVRAWTRCYQISPWFVLDGKYSTASWMWVKQ